MAATQQQQRQQADNSQSEAEQRVQNYMLDDEEVSYSLRFRPIGVVNWLKSLLGFGVTYWFVTNQRVIETTRVGGGFTFKDVSHDKISSIEYGNKVSLGVIAIGIILGLVGLGILAESAILGISILIVGLGLVGYAYWRQQQVLAVKASGGARLALTISKGQKVDEFIWYLHAERTKHTD